MLLAMSTEAPRIPTPADRALKAAGADSGTGVERSLVDQARGGDQRAFEAIYRATAGAVYGLCLRLTADVHQAEECVQQTYVQAWRNLSRFRGESTLTTWLHRIAVNEVRSHFRRERRHRVPGSDEEPVDPQGEGSYTRDLENAIAALPERARAVFVLVGIYGHPHEEAAAMLSIAVGTSKAHYHHAKRQLRRSLGERHDDD